MISQEVIKKFVTYKICIKNITLPSQLGKNIPTVRVVMTLILNRKEPKVVSSGDYR